LFLLIDKSKSGGGKMKMRQRVRFTLIFISLLLFPVTFFYLSPNIIIFSTLEGKLAGDGIIFMVLFLSALFFGRLFCGWLCPAAGLQETCFLVQKKKTNRNFSWTKYLFWIPWIAGIILILISKGFYREIDFAYQTHRGISLSTHEGFMPYIIFYSVLAFFIALALLTGKRGFCHHACWIAPFMLMGSFVGRKTQLPRMKLSFNSKSCIHCQKCNEHCPMSLDVHEMVQMNFNDHPECVLCGTCMDQCNEKVIRYSFNNKH
jgi:ferredoxin-type protein NapH